MSNKMRRSTEMLRSLLTTGTLEEARTAAPETPPAETSAETRTEAPIAAETRAPETVPPETRTEAPAAAGEPGPAAAELAALREEVAALREAAKGLVTTKEQHRRHLEAIGRRDAELADKRLMGMLEQLCIMREDFLKLCRDMEERIGRFAPEDVLGSFTAYSTDIENILTDAGARVGAFDDERLNTLRQRIVDVVPTDDPSLDGTVAERLSDGYEFNGRVLLKERVRVYRHTAVRSDGPQEGDG